MFKANTLNTMKYMKKIAYTKAGGLVPADVRVNAAKDRVN